MDDETQRLMNKPRCGNPDVNPKAKVTRRKRSAGKTFMRNHFFKNLFHAGNVLLKFDKNTLTYRIKNYPRAGASSLSQDIVRQLVRNNIESSLLTWARVSNLNFVYTEDESADLEFAFETGNHGDNYAFDGKGKLIAHAMFPKSGKIHFDDDEVWCFSLTEHCGKL